jgi:Asp/Glu/hydantoin racemase
MTHILVLNPNSSTGVTASMDAALDIIRLHGGPEIVCQTLAEGPPGIETQEHLESVVLPLVRHLEANAADAYVVGCFSDPGLALAREKLKGPVLGISESAFQMAIGLGQRFGVVAIKSGSIPRHMRYIRSLGLAERLAGDRPLEIGVTELLDSQRVIDRIIEVGRDLRDRRRGRPDPRLRQHGRLPPRARGATWPPRHSPHPGRRGPGDGAPRTRLPPRRVSCLEKSGW